MSSVSAVNTLLSGTATTTSSVDISNILASASGATTAGIDVTAAVASAIAADRAPETAWKDDIATLSSQTTALNAMQTAAESLATDMQSLNTLTGPLAARTVASSNSNYLTATAATGTTSGAHTVVINSLATTGSWYSDIESDPTTVLATSAITITPTGGTATTFATGLDSSGNKNAGDTLKDLASAINTANIGVNATVVSDSTGSRLAIISNTSGLAGGFSVTSPNYTGTSWTSPDIPTGGTLGANSVTLTSSTGTATISTTSGETYAQLAAAINNATVAPTSYSSSQTPVLTSSSLLSAGSVTTIKDNATGSTFTFTATATNTVGDLNTAIAAAVTAGTLSSTVAGAIDTNGNEVISEGATNTGMTVATNDAKLGGAMTAAAESDAKGTNISIASSSSSFTINEPAFGFTQAAAAADASLTVDGVPIQSASNTVTGTIAGVTLTLLGASLGSPISLTVASDATQVSTAINQFVTDYNTALGLVNTQFAETSTTDSSGNTTTGQGVLASDPTVVALQGALEQAAAYVYTPPTGTTTTVSNLSDLGITTGNDGTLSVDSSTLNAALVNNPSDVVSFLQGSALNGFANSVYSAVNTFTNPADGSFEVDLSSISSSSSALTTQINDFETGYIASQQTLLTADYTKAEVALQDLPQEMAELNSELGFTKSSS
jgi:flagellar hook-associated protein 2